jgi:probable biosynthetic protein (TIGR04098 family)
MSQGPTLTQNDDKDQFPQLSFTVGMPNMVPDQLSEVEFMKIFAEFQWCQLGAALDCPSHLLKSEEGDRLYASVVQVESHFGRDESIAQYQEGDVVHARGTVRFHAKHFVEGWSVFAKEAVPRETVERIRCKADLDQLDATWVCMTNAIVARLADNNRLKTFGPAGIEDKDVPVAPEKPQGIVEHEHVMQTGEIEPLFSSGLVPLVPIDESPVTYRIELENDMNGAGLLYFARYIAMMNYAERIFLLRRLKRPFSQQLIRFLSTEHRRTYVYANATETDEVLIHCSGAAIEPDQPPKRGGLRTRALRFQFFFDLHRKSDGVLMAKSVVTKTLSIPNRFSNLRGEARRFAKMILDEAR